MLPKELTDMKKLSIELSSHVPSLQLVSIQYNLQFNNTILNFLEIDCFFYQKRKSDPVNDQYQILPY